MAITDAPGSVTAEQLAADALEVATTTRDLLEKWLPVLERVDSLLTRATPLLERYLNNPAARFAARAKGGR